MSSQIVKLDERQIQGKNSHERIKAQQKMLSSEAQSKQAELELLEQNLIEQQNILTEHQNKLSIKQKNFAELESNLKLQTEKRQKYEQSVSALQKKLSAAQNQSLITEHDLTVQINQQQINEINESKLNEEVNQLEQECINLKTQETDLNSEIDNAENHCQSLKKSLAETTKSAHALQSEQIKLNQQYNALESRLQILQKMQQSYEGFSKAPKAVLMSKAEWRKKICGAVGELLIVPKKFAAAIEIALGGSVQNIITEDESAAKAAIEFLKNKKLGRVTFLPLSRIAVSTQLFKINV